ncbi:hypothetical protein MHYP_G00062610 [Metynnis hypsauchen]
MTETRLYLYKIRAGTAIKRLPRVVLAPCPSLLDCDEGCGEEKHTEQRWTAAVHRITMEGGSGADRDDGEGCGGLNPQPSPPEQASNQLRKRSLDGDPAAHGEPGDRPERRRYLLKSIIQWGTPGRGESWVKLKRSSRRPVRAQR